MRLRLSWTSTGSRFSAVVTLFSCAIFPASWATRWVLHRPATRLTARPPSHPRSGLSLLPRSWSFGLGLASGPSRRPAPHRPQPSRAASCSPTLLLATLSGWRVSVSSLPRFGGCRTEVRSPQPRCGRYVRSTTSSPSRTTPRTVTGVRPATWLGEAFSGWASEFRPTGLTTHSSERRLAAGLVQRHLSPVQIGPVGGGSSGGSDIGSLAGNSLGRRTQRRPAHAAGPNQ